MTNSYYTIIVHNFLNTVVIKVVPSININIHIMDILITIYYYHSLY